MDVSWQIRWMFRGKKGWNSTYPQMRKELTSNRWMFRGKSVTRPSKRGLMFVDFTSSEPCVADPRSLPTKDYFSNIVVDPVSIVDSPMNRFVMAALSPITRLAGIAFDDWTTSAYKFAATWLRDAFHATSGRLLPRYKDGYINILNRRRWGEIMYCTPPFVKQSGTHGRFCHSRVCPWCHTRSLIKIFQSLSASLAKISVSNKISAMVVGSKVGRFPISINDHGEPDFASALHEAVKFVHIQRKKLNTESTAGAISWAVPDLFWNEGRVRSLRVHYGVIAVQSPKGFRYKKWPVDLTRTEFDTTPSAEDLANTIIKAFPTPAGWWHNSQNKPFAGALAFDRGMFRIKLSMTQVVRDMKLAENSNNLMQWMAVWSYISDKVGFEVTADVANDLLIKNGFPAVAGKPPKAKTPKVQTSALLKKTKPNKPAETVRLPREQVLAMLQQFGNLVGEFHDVVEEIESSDRTAQAAEEFLHGADGKSGVIQKVESIDRTVNQTKRVTDNQMTAVKNILEGAKRWLHRD